MEQLQAKRVSRGFGVVIMRFMAKSQWAVFFLGFCLVFGKVEVNLCKCCENCVCLCVSVGKQFWARFGQNEIG